MRNQDHKMALKVFSQSRPTLVWRHALWRRGWAHASQKLLWTYLLDIAVYKIDVAMKHAHAVFQTACILREDASLKIKCHRINVKETTMSIERNVVSTQAKKLENCAHIGGKTNGELSTVACTSTNFKTTQPRRVSTTYNRAENNRSNMYSFLGPPSPHRIEFWLCLLSSRPNSFSLSLFGLSILIWLWT